MTKQELRLELLKLQEQGLLIQKMHQEGFSFNSNPQYAQWMTAVSLFEKRHLKDHPLYRDMEDACFFKDDYQKGFFAMLGLLDTIGKDNEYWQQSPTIDTKQSPILSANHQVAEPTESARPAVPTQAAETQKSKIRNTIFISHRSVDKDVADMLFEFLIKTGIPREAVFCSSLPGNDVKQLISAEVKEALNTSKVNIAILSKDYYQSAYCVNEAGILWYLDTVRVIPITLPEIKPEDMIGFLNKEFKARSLDNTDDIAYIYDTITEALEIQQQKISVINAESGKLRKKYSEYISKKAPSPTLAINTEKNLAELNYIIPESIEASVVLTYAANLDGHISVASSIGGKNYVVGGQYPLMKGHSPRESAKWDQVIEILQEKGFIKFENSNKGNALFSVTDKGYHHSDAFKGQYAIDMAMPPNETIENIKKEY